MLLLGLSSGSEGGLSLEVLLGDTGDSVSDGRVGRSLKFSSGSDILGVLGKVLSLLTVQCLGKSGDFLTLFSGERQPADLLGSELGLGLDGNGGVE